MIHRAQLLICGSHVSTYFILGWTWGPQSTQGQWDRCPLWKQKNLPWPKYPSTYQSSFWAGYLSGWVKWLFLSCPSSEIPCKLMEINHLPWPHPFYCLISVAIAHGPTLGRYPCKYSELPLPTPNLWTSYGLWAKSCDPMILVMKLAKSMVQWYVHVNVHGDIYIYTHIYIYT